MDGELTSRSKPTAMAFGQLPEGRRLGHTPPPPRPLSVWRHRCGQCRPPTARLLRPHPPRWTRNSMSRSRGRQANFATKTHVRRRVSNPKSDFVQRDCGDANRQPFRSKRPAHRRTAWPDFRRPKAFRCLILEVALVFSKRSPPQVRKPALANQEFQNPGEAAFDDFRDQWRKPG